jgi:arylsulfatase A-like enzyme
MGRKILFVTTDQQRYDALGCNGGTIARTPVIDGLAAQGVTYRRAHPQSVVCMPSRATMITGQHVHTHGVWMNGVPLPVDAPSVAAVLHDAGYATALIGKSHFEPYFDPFIRFEENRLGATGEFGPHRGFDHMELATHGANGMNHYTQWMRAHHPEAIGQFFPVLGRDLEVSGEGGGDTAAPQVKANHMPTGIYHTAWVADRTTAWLDSLDDDADWFCWMSFPDPHHPWDPPAEETHRVDWRELELPGGYLPDRSEREAVIDAKPRHWRLWYDGDLVGNYEAPAHWVPATMTPDQVREINAMAHIENELIDEALGRVLGAVDRRGWSDDVDVIFTTDHGELQGDYGLMFKGPYHVDSLMRLPLIWRPAPSSAMSVNAEVTRPVGHVDLAPTFCSIAGIEAPPWMEGRVLPDSDDDADSRGFDNVITVWDSVQPNGTRMHLRSAYRDGMVITAYDPGTVHDGSEGELYDLADDPHQRRNLWDDPGSAAIRRDLVTTLTDEMPPYHPDRNDVQAPV